MESGTTENTLEKINQINLYQRSIKRNPNLSKFGLLICPDLPIRKSNWDAIWDLRVFRTLVYFYIIKYKMYTFFLRKCTRRLENFQNSSTSRARILIGWNSAKPFQIPFDGCEGRFSWTSSPANISIGNLSMNFGNFLAITAINSVKKR